MLRFLSGFPLIRGLQPDWNHTFPAINPSLLSSGTSGGGAGGTSPGGCGTSGGVSGGTSLGGSGTPGGGAGGVSFGGVTGSSGGTGSVDRCSEGSSLTERVASVLSASPDCFAMTVISRYQLLLQIYIKRMASRIDLGQPIRPAIVARSSESDARIKAVSVVRIFGPVWTYNGLMPLLW